ncbi:unnamed protein product, partial [Symbiodinium sp. CCMP2456]
FIGCSTTDECCRTVEIEIRSPSYEDVRADIYGKMRPGVPKVSDLPPDASKKIRARRAQQLAELHRREEAFAAPAELPVAALRAAKEPPARAGDVHPASPAQAAES